MLGIAAFAVRAWVRLVCLGRSIDGEAKLLCVLVQEGDRAYYKLRLERTNAKLVGVRSKRAAEAAAEEAAKAK